MWGPQSPYLKASGVVLLIFLIRVVVGVLLSVLVLPVLVLVESMGGLGFLDLGIREFDSGERPQSMRFFGGRWEINLRHVFGRG